MKKQWRRRVLGVALSLTAAAGGLLVGGNAHAQTVTNGSLRFSGDSGDYISQGKTHSYSTGNGDALDVSSSGGSTVRISVNAYNGDWWSLEFDAPGSPDRPVAGRSTVLVPGTYTAAHRYPFNGTGPGLNLSGDGRGCNELTGSFTITKAVFGAEGYVQAFDATFEQHCEGGTAAARGEIHISNASAPTQAAPKRTTATSRPKAAAGKPSASATATAAGKPSATAPGEPSAAAGSDTPAPALAADTPAGPAATNEVSSALLRLLGIGVIGWLILNVIGAVTVGTVMAARRR